MLLDDLNVVASSLAHSVVVVLSPRHEPWSLLGLIKDNVVNVIMTAIACYSAYLAHRSYKAAEKSADATVKSADATKLSAEAAVKSADEARETRLTFSRATRPLLEASKVMITRNRHRDVTVMPTIGTIQITLTNTKDIPLSELKYAIFVFGEQNDLLKQPDTGLKGGQTHIGVNSEITYSFNPFNSNRQDGNLSIAIYYEAIDHTGNSSGKHKLFYFLTLPNITEINGQANLSIITNTIHTSKMESDIMDFCNTEGLSSSNLTYFPF